MGGEARRFVDFLAESQVTVWQILPLTPTGGDGCPYNSCSAFAGNEILIDPVPLMEQGLLDEDLQVPEFSDIRVDYDAVIKFKSDILAAASERFFAGEYDKHILKTAATSAPTTARTTSTSTETTARRITAAPSHAERFRQTRRG